MDLELDENQRSIADLTLQILRESLTPRALRAIEASDDHVAADEWQKLATAGLLGVPLPEDVGGGGFGLVEACLVLEQVGRTVAPLPYLQTVVGAAMTIDAFGTPAQRQSLLPRVVDGSLVLAVAFAEFGDELATALPATTATRDGAGWRLDGEKPLVPMAHVADRLLVSARTGASTCGVFLVDPRERRASRLETTETTARELRSTVRLAGVRVAAEDVIGAPDARHGDRRRHHQAAPRRALRDAGRRLAPRRSASRPRTSRSASSSARRSRPSRRSRSAPPTPTSTPRRSR